MRTSAFRLHLSRFLLLFALVGVSGCGQLTTWLTQLQRDPLGGFNALVSAIDTGVSLATSVGEGIAAALPPDDASVLRQELQAVVQRVHRGIAAARSILTSAEELTHGRVQGALAAAFEAVEELRDLVATWGERAPAALRTPLRASARRSGAEPPGTLAEAHAAALDALDDALPAERRTHRPR